MATLSRAAPPTPAALLPLPRAAPPPLLAGRAAAARRYARGPSAAARRSWVVASSSSPHPHGPCSAASPAGRPLPRRGSPRSGKSTQHVKTPFSLQVHLTKFPSLPPSFQQTPNAVEELKLARDIYEHAVVLSVKLEDQDAFERDFCQLKPYYMDTCGIIPPSPEEYPILGLNLLRLLVQNRIAKFHTELELLPVKALEHPCIKHAVELEQSFTEGAYNRVLSARQAVPHETYVYFMDLLAKTVR